MALLRDLATDRPLMHATGGRVVMEGYFVTTAAGAVLSQEFPPGYSVARTDVGTYVLTVPGASTNLAIPALVSAHSLHTVRCTSAVEAACTLKTATLSVATTIDVGQATAVSTPVYTVADISGLVVTVLVIGKE